MSQMPPRAVLNMREFCHWAAIGRTKAYEEIGSGRLPAIKIGTRTMIPMAAAEAWLAAQPVYGEV